MDLKKHYYNITKSQYRFLEEYLRSGDKRESLKAGRYSFSEANLDKNFQAVMDIEKVGWAYRKMVREREGLKSELDEVPHVVVSKVKRDEVSSQDVILERLLDSLNDALAIAKMRKNPSAMANVVKILAEIQGLYQPKKQVQEALRFIYQTGFDGECPKCGYVNSKK